MARDMRERRFERPDPVRLARHPGMDRDRHDAAALALGFAVEHVELVAHLVDELRLGMVVAHHDRLVVDLVRVRHRVDGAVLGLDSVGHVVVDPVADVIDALGRHEVERILRFRLGGGEPAGHGLARGLAQDTQRLLNERCLFGFGEPAVVELAHIDAVRDHLPAARVDLVDEQRIALGNLRIHRDRGLDPELVEQLEDAEDADPVAVVAQRVVPEIGIGRDHAARRLEGLGRLVEREEFERRHDPERDARAVRPLDLRAFLQDRPFVTVVIHAIAALGVFQIIVGERHRFSLPYAWRCRRSPCRSGVPNTTGRSRGPSSPRRRRGW